MSVRLTSRKAYTLVIDDMMFTALVDGMTHHKMAVDDYLTANTFPISKDKPYSQGNVRIEIGDYMTYFTQDSYLKMNKAAKDLGYGDILQYLKIRYGQGLAL
jgi:hypothetical protein